MKGILLLVLSVVYVCSLPAQSYTSKKGFFQVDQVRGCAPFTVTINNPNFGGKVCSPCTMYYNGVVGENCPISGGVNNLFSFTYNTPGTYQLCVSYPVVGNDIITITVDPNTPPPFDIFSCANNQVSIKITDRFYDLYRIDFNNDGVVDTSIPSTNSQVAQYNFGASGNYTLNVKGEKLNSSKNCASNLQPFTAIPALPPPILNNLTAVDAATLNLSYTPQTNIEYRADIAFNNAVNFQQYKTLFAVNSLTAPGLNLNANYYCFRLASFDPCNNSSTYTFPVCSHQFSATAINGATQLGWQTSSMGVAATDVLRNINQSAFSTIATLPSTSTAYLDDKVNCKTKYCYQLVSTYAGGVTSTSLANCVTTFSKQTPSAINNISAVVGNTDTSVDLVWLQDAAYTAAGYTILRSQNGGSYLPNGNTTSKQYTDATYTATDCYRIKYTDNCDNASAEGLRSCPMVLSGSINDANDPTLKWNSYKGWQQGVKEYTIQKFNAGGQLIQTYTSTDTTYTDVQADPINQIVLYKITAVANEAGVSASISNEIKITKEVHLFYPTAFNPESKLASVNKTFTVKGQYIAKLQLHVFDRWGALLYSSDQNEPWDGRKEGASLPDGTYVWTAEGVDYAGNSFKKSGTIFLIKK